MKLATVIRRSDGKAVSQITVSNEATLDAYKDADHDVVEGWDVPIEPPVQPTQDDNLRNKRNRLLDGYAWTYRADSPLTQKNQNEWLNWSKQMQKATLTGHWPDQPGLEFAP